MTRQENTLTHLEDTVRAQKKRERIECAILGTLSIVGIFSVGAIAPNVAGLLARILPDQRPASQRQSVKRAIGRLIRKGYIQKRGGKYVLTQGGSLRLTNLEQRASLIILGVLAPPLWDGKWRVVVFDVKEKRRHVRNELRRILIEAGFVRLQDSVWVYPYQCDEIIALLKFHLRLGFDLIYMIADALEGDDILRRHFNLLSSRA